MPDRPVTGRVWRAGLQVAGASCVLLTATGATAVPDSAQTETDIGAARAAAVAAVWRAGATAALDASGAGVSGTAAEADAVQQADVLAAELLAGRDATGTSRSAERLAATAAAPATAPASAAAPDGAVTVAPADQLTPPSAPADDPVAQARQRVQELAVQQVADDVDGQALASAELTSAAQARDVVLAAQEQRAAEAATAALAAAQADPRGIAEPLVAERGWDSEQFACLDRLWTKESGWSWSADNPTSSAYGIPQSLPGEKMGSHGGDWETNPVTQIAWGLDYIADAYGAPCSAWRHSQATDWY